MKVLLQKTLFVVLTFLCFKTATSQWKSAPPTNRQVTVDINSGNPIFPFPQFLAYESSSHKLENLGTQNAPGVTHAEMEQRIRDAWQIMANRFWYSGESYAGVRYISPNAGCPHDCSEGVGYAMLVAAEIADKTTFDGIWFKAHDDRLINQPRYRDCIVPSPGYQFGRYTIRENTGGSEDSATDGDVDIALGLLVAYKQWGEDSGYKDACGNIINYKEEALKVIRGLVERTDRGLGDCRRTSGDIGFDGYFKGGNTWNELTDWATGATPECPEYAGPRPQFIDYTAPSYFHAFANFLENEGDSSDIGWNINQFKRAEASSDWLMGKMLDNPLAIPVAGRVSINKATNTPIFEDVLFAEDARNPWRTILNYVWHGNPETSWNPSTHQVVNTPNSYEKDIGLRYAKFLKDPSASPWNNNCLRPGTSKLTYSGPSQIVNDYEANTGKIKGGADFPINWLPGTGTPSAVTAQDFDLMGKLYRQCAIEWDTTTNNDGYLNSIPFYFHGFFRTLGMMVVSGNHHSPANLKLESNVKIYHKVDKTFAFTGDELEYTISYRNYASIEAQNVQITTTLPTGLSFISATDGGVNLGNTITWNIGTVKGFKTSSGISATEGEVILKVKVEKGVASRVCNQFEITTSNGKGWISNEYPNEKTAVMQRNCIDIATRALEIKKTVNHTEVNPGDEVTYTIDFENASSGGFLNGGRPGVNVAYAHGGHAASSTEKLVQLRIYNGADEPYIDYGNYRISMFLNDNGVTCVSGEPGCTGTGWVLDSQIYEGGDRNNVSITSESIVPGSDVRGAWNQRVIVKFSEQLATITPHLERYFGIKGGRVHQGGATPLRAVWQMHTDKWSAVEWDDDWSWNPTVNDAKDGLFYPVTNNWTDPKNPDIPVTEYHNEACIKPTKTIDNILVEEWDGFTWRRVFGNSPAPGREVENVILKDILPIGFTFVGFVDDIGTNLGNSVTILEETANYDTATRTITWTKPKMQVKEKGVIRYKAIANFSSGICPRADELQINTASIEAKNESPTLSTAEVNITCTPVILPPPPSSMTKTVTPKSAIVGDEINYTLEYKNTDGSPFEADFTKPWTTRVGNPMNIVAGTGVTTITNNLGVFTHNFSHGTNGEIEASVNFSDNQAFGFVLRYTGASSTGLDKGLYIVFKPNFGSGNGIVRVYNGTLKIDETSFSTSANPVKIKLRLADDQLQLWVGNTSNPSPNWVATGIPIRAGYAGIINGFPDGTDIFGSHQITKFKSSLDSAFDLQITDPVPNEVSFVSSLDGVNNSGIIEFPKLAGPVLAGTQISYNWKAKVNSCPTTTNKIVNIGYTNALGLPKDFIRAQAILDCSGTDICSTLTIPKPTVSTIPEICLGSTAPKIETYINATENLVWYTSLLGTSAIATPIIDTSIAGSSSYFVSQITKDNCESERTEVIIEVKDLLPGKTETKTIKSGEVVNFDLVSEMGFTSGTVEWNTTNNTNITGESITVINTDVINDKLINTSNINQTVVYTINETPVNGCPLKPSTLTVTVEPPILTVEIDDDTTIEGGNLQFTVTLSRITTTPTVIEFNITNVSTISTDYTIPITSTITIPIGDTTGQIIIPTIDDTLVETTEELKISITSINTIPITTVQTGVGKIEDNDIACPTIPLPVVTNVNLCIGDTPSDIATYVKATETLVWYANATSLTPIPKPIIFTASANSIEYYVSQKNTADCESSREKIEIKITDSKPAKTDTITIESGASVNYDLISKMGLVTGTTWIATDNPSISGESLINITNDNITDILTNNSTITERVTYTITENDASSPCGRKNSTVAVAVTPKPTLAIFANSVEEGNDLEIDITLSKAIQKVVTVEVNFTANTASIADLSLTPETVTFNPGEITKSFKRATIDDAIIETDELVDISISDVITGNASILIGNTQGTIKDNDKCGLTSPSAIDAEFCINDTPSSLNTFITATETIIWYSDSNPTTPPIAIPIVNTTTASEITYYVSQKNSISGCESSRAPIKVTVTKPKTAKSESIIINNGTATLNYNIESKLGLKTGTYSWVASENNNVTGETTSVLTSNIINDVLENTSKSEQKVLYTITETTSTKCPNPPTTLTVTIYPKVNIPTNPTVNIGSVIIEEGKELPITIEFSKSLSFTSKVTISFDAISASDQDLNLNSEEIIFLPGETKKVIQRPTIDDDLIEGDETLRVSISNIDTKLLTIQKRETIATIKDNDTPPPCAISLPVILNNPEACLGEPLNILDFIVANETLVWYTTATTALTTSQPIIDTNIVQETTFYISQKNAFCESNRVPITVIIKDIENGINDSIEIESGDSLSYNISEEMGLTSGEISWFAKTNTYISGQNTFPKFSDIISDELINTSEENQTIIYEISEALSKNLCERNPSFLEVIVKPEKQEIEYPLFFTPNNDSENDFWQVKVPNDSTIRIKEIKIFDRYGNLLSIFDGKSKGWNGEYNNTPSPGDDYWYVINFENRSQKLGHFSLIR